VATLIFLLSFGNYSVANFLRFNTFVLDSFVEFSAFYNYDKSFALSSVLIVFIVILLYLERLYVAKRDYVSSFENFSFDNINPIDLKSYKMALFVLVSLLASVLVITPIFLLIYKSASLQNYIDAFLIAKMSLYRSLLYAFFGASLITFFGFFIAYTIRNSLFRSAYFLDIISIVLFGIPGTILGVALIQFYNNDYSSFIYASPIIIIFGYIAKYSAISSRIFIANLKQIPPSMQESAELLGASWFYSMVHITAPLAQGGFLLSWFISFIFLLRDTDITMLLYSAGYDTLAIKIFTLMANSPSQIIAALCVIMIVIILVPLGLLYLLKGLNK
jgi:iron(III) transport system permease protein